MAWPVRRQRLRQPDPAPTSWYSSAPDPGAAPQRWPVASSISAAAPPLQTACGFTDSVDNMAAFLNVAMGPGADENRIADYCAGSVAHFDWLVGCGVPFKAEFFSEPGWEPMGDQGLMYSGGENSYPVQHDRDSGPAWTRPADAEQEAGRGQRRLHADEAAGRDRHGGRRAGALRRSGAMSDRRIGRQGGRPPCSPIRHRA